MDKNIRDIINICKLEVPELKKYLSDRLKQFGYKVNSKSKYVFAKGQIPVVVVAHMDTVHLTPPATIWITIDGTKIASDEGIGGDDRCGIFIILRLLEAGYRPYVLFTDEEEVGGLGAYEFTYNMAKDALKNIKYFLEFDRAGLTDVINYDDDNSSLIRYIEKFGFMETYGTFTDICVLCEHFGISGVNISSAYNFAHTEDEEINVPGILTIIEKAKRILSDVDNVGKFKFKKSKYVHSGYGSYYNYYGYKNNNNKNYGKGYSSYKGYSANTYKDTSSEYSSYSEVVKKFKPYNGEKLNPYMFYAPYPIGERSGDLKRLDIKVYEYGIRDKNGYQFYEYFYGTCESCGAIAQLYDYNSFFLCENCADSYTLNICEDCGTCYDVGEECYVCNHLANKK